jgi:enamine deaminase RidA (YjgF/YER057c/UK114 family)
MRPFAALLLATATLHADAVPRRIGAASGPATALVVPLDKSLAHTEQVLPFVQPGVIGSPGKIDEQLTLVLDRLRALLRTAGSASDKIVKLHVVLARADDLPAVEKALAQEFGKAQPTVTFVVGKLPHADALVALDAVAIATPVEPMAANVVRFDKGGRVAVLPPGPRVYIAGQAERGSTLAEATRRTLDSLRATLKFLDLQDEHVVQLKTFLNPMSAVPDVEREIVAFYGAQRTPPVVHVEWNGPNSIEIELIAASPAAKRTEAVEFLTPPFMKPSPIFSRVARINRGQLVYVGGLYGRSGSDAASQVTDILTSLERICQEAGSDLKHLAKATYYVSDEAASQKLNEIRPKWYDPKRPPAASKAGVAGVGRPKTSLTIDMIAVAP